jgi:cytidine deaminase
MTISDSSSNPLTVADHDLITEADDLIRKYFHRGRHHVVAVIRCNDRVYPAIHLNSPGLDICAEPIAIASVLLAGESWLDSIVAVSWTGMPDDAPRIIPPCGNCRQLLLDYVPEIRVILPTMWLRPADLLPHPYTK